MIGVFIKLLIIFFLALLFFGFVFVLGIFRSLANLRDTFMNMGDNVRKEKGRGRKGETVIDQRPEQEASQKIFSKDEGEYVDYEDVE